MKENINYGFKESLSKRTTAGTFWVFTFSILNKAVTFVSQIVLAWFLLPEDMGLAAMAFSVTNVISFLSGTILKDVLIQKQKHFSELCSEVFWLSLSLNLFICLLLFIIAPISEHIFGNEKVEYLILIIAVAIPLQAIPTVYSSKIFIDLNFKKISAIHFALGFIQNGIAVFFASVGFGAYSLTIPLIITAVISIFLHRAVAGKINIIKISFSQWSFLLKSALWLMLIGLLENSRTYGLNFIVGAMHTPSITGHFFWGFTVASQFIFLISTNLKNVFFPSFSKITEYPERQFNAFQKTLKTLLFFSGLIIGLQFILTKPLVELIFTEKWYPSIPVIELLSLGIYLQPAVMLSSSIILSRGEYKKLFGINFLISIIVLIGCTYGSITGNEVYIAKWVAAGLILSGILVLFFTYSFLGYKINFVIKLLTLQFISLISSLIIAYYFINTSIIESFTTKIILSAFIYLAVFLTMNFIFQKEVITEILKSVKQLFDK